MNTRINLLQWILTKLGTYLVLRRVWNPIDFQGHRSRSQGPIFRRGDTPRFALPLLWYLVWNTSTSMFFFILANPLGILAANVIVPAMVTSCDGHDILGAVSLYLITINYMPKIYKAANVFPFLILIYLIIHISRFTVQSKTSLFSVPVSSYLVCICIRT